MWDQIANNLVTHSVEKGVVSEDERALYEYGYQLVLSRVATWGIFLLLGLLFHCVGEVVLFIIFFIPLRCYCGGYHERSYLRCYVSSCALFLAVILVGAVWGTMDPMWYIPFLIAPTIVILIWAPMQDPNKPLDYNERTKYRFCSRAVLILEIALIIGLGFFLGNTRVSFFAFEAISVNGVLVLLSVMKQKRSSVFN